jgi:hypothetical protein
VSKTFDPEGNLTHQSFRDECDINNIIELHTRTGLVTHINEQKPQYGEAPEMDLHEAACVHAEIRSAYEDGFEPSDKGSGEVEPGQEPVKAPEGSQEPSEDPSESAAKVEQSGT